MKLKCDDSSTIMINNFISQQQQIHARTHTHTYTLASVVAIKCATVLRFCIYYIVDNTYTHTHILKYDTQVFINI